MRLSTSPRAPVPTPAPQRSPEEEAAIREGHDDEYRSGLDSVDDTPDDSAAMQAARLFAAGIACACPLGEVVR